MQADHQWQSLTALQPLPRRVMAAYDEVEIEDMDFDESLQAFTYQCPCGDLFQISMVCAQ